MIQNAETQLPQQSSTFVWPNEDQSQTVSNDVYNNTIKLTLHLSFRVKQIRTQSPLMKIKKIHQNKVNIATKQQFNLISILFQVTTITKTVSDTVKNII